MAHQARDSEETTRQFLQLIHDVVITISLNLDTQISVGPEDWNSHIHGFTNTLWLFPPAGISPFVEGYTLAVVPLGSDTPSHIKSLVPGGKNLVSCHPVAEGNYQLQVITPSGSLLQKEETS